MSDNIGLSKLSRDYDTLIAEIKELIPNLTDDWTDFSDGDAGMFLIKLVAAIKDMQSYHQDKVAMEAFLPTASQRASVVSLLKLIGYTLSSYKSATVSMKCIAYSVVNEVELSWPISVVMSDSSGTKIYCVAFKKDNEDVTGLKGDGTVVIKFHQGKLSSWPAIDSSTKVLSGLTDVNGDSVVAGSPICIADSSVKVAIDGTSFITATSGSDTLFGDNYTEVKSFVKGIYGVSGSNAEDYHWYRLYVDRDNRVYLEFSSSADSIWSSSGFKLNYLETGGADISIGSGVSFTSLSSDYSATFETVSESTGGEDPETIEHARENAPIEARTLDRFVSTYDYTYGVKDVLLNSSDYSGLGVFNVACSVVDFFKNVNGGSYKISSFPEQWRYFLLVYCVYSNAVISEITLSDGSLTYRPSLSVLGKSNALSMMSYLDGKRMVCVRPIVMNNVANNTDYLDKYAEVYNSGTFIPSGCPLNLIYVRCKFYYSSDYSSIMTVAKKKALNLAVAEELKLSDSMFGCVLRIGRVYNVLHKTLSSVDFELTGTYAPTFSVSVGTTIYGTGDLITFTGTYSEYTAKYNELIVFDGIDFVEVS